MGAFDDEVQRQLSEVTSKTTDMVVKILLSNVRCGYCNNRAHATEWEGDQLVPVCKTHVEVRATD